MTSNLPMFPLDWLGKIEAAYSPFVQVIFLEEAILTRWRKSKHFDEWLYPQSRLKHCEMCGRQMWEKRLLYSGLPCFDRADGYVDWHVCIGCNSRIAAIRRRFDRFCENRALINKLQKAITHVTKGENDRRSEGHSAEDLGRGAERYDGACQGFGDRQDRGANQHVAAH